MTISDWAHLAFKHMVWSPPPTSYLGFWSPRGSASVSTLVRRMSYGGRKGRRAERRLKVLIGAMYAWGFFQEAKAP